MATPKTSSLGSQLLLPTIRVRVAERPYRGDAANSLNERYEQVLQGNDKSFFWSEQTRQSALMGFALDPVVARTALRAYAASRGEDFDALVADASKHFSSADIARSTPPLTSQELETLFEDDQRSLDR
jgi:hypothetical protein